MSKSWPTVRLEEVLRRSEETAEPVADAEYREITVRLWGNGIVERGRVLGGLLSGRRFVAHAGQFIASRIDARNGAMGLVPESLEGALVTNDFPLFNVNTTRLEPAFLGWLCRTAGFVELCLRASEGTTNRVRLKEDRFLALEIPLPPLAEQRRVVARIEELAAQIHEARTLRHQAAEEAEALLVAMAHRADLDQSAKERGGWKRKRLSDVVQFVDDSHNVEPDRSYPNLGIYSFGRGLFHKPPIDGLSTSATALRRVKSGQFIYSRLFAFEGAYGRVTPEFDGAFVSQEYPTFDCDYHQVRSEFLAAYFKPPHLWKAVAAGSKGLGDRRQRVQPAQVLAHELWLPPIEWQNRLAEVQAEVDALKRLQAETAAELAALLPSVLDRAFQGAL
jgi:type I restriction enzyme S subunit